MNKFIQVDSNKIYFSKSKSSNYHSSVVKLYNIVNKTVIFKIFINKNILYRASPSEGFIPPNGTTTVSIKRITNEALTSDKPDQFLIVAFDTNQTIKSVFYSINKT